MKSFLIDSENHTYAPGSGREPAGEGATFRSQEELEALAASWPAGRLVEIWNQLPAVTPVRKFTDRATAIRRIWTTLQNDQPAAAEKIGSGEGQRTRRGQAVKAASPATTKTQKVIALLKRPSGATLAQIMKLTGWQSHSVRGFISAQLSKRRGLRVRSFRREGERVYRIRG